MKKQEELEKKARELERRERELESHSLGPGAGKRGRAVGMHIFKPRYLIIIATMTVHKRMKSLIRIRGRIQTRVVMGACNKSGFFPLLLFSPSK